MKRFPRGACPLTPLGACAFGARFAVNRSTFFLDPRLPCSVPSETVVSGKNAAQTTRVEHFLCPSAVDIQVTCGSQVLTLDFSMSLSNA